MVTGNELIKTMMNWEIGTQTTMVMNLIMMMIMTLTMDVMIVSGDGFSVFIKMLKGLDFFQ